MINRHCFAEKKTINVTQYQLAAILISLSQGKTRNLRFSFEIFSQKTEIEIFVEKLLKK